MPSVGLYMSAEESEIEGNGIKWEVGPKKVSGKWVMWYWREMAGGHAIMVGGGILPPQTDGRLEGDTLATNTLHEIGSSKCWGKTSSRQ